MKRKLLFLRRRHTDTTLGTVLKGDGKQLTKIHPDDAMQWSRSFESLILDKSELALTFALALLEAPTCSMSFNVIQ